MRGQREWVVDRGSPEPIYLQLAAQFRQAIESGDLQAGEKFENEVALADRLGLARPTVRRALADLVDAGLLVRRRGLGTVVADRLVHRHDQLTSLNDDLVASGRTSRTELLRFEAGVIDERAAAILGLPPTTGLVFVQRLRSAGGMPLGILTNWLPPQYADLTRDELESTGLYCLLRARGVRPVVGRQTIGARTATARERDLLRIPRSQPLLTMSRDAFDAEGRPVECGSHCYRADQYAFEFTVHEDWDGRAERSVPSAFGGVHARPGACEQPGPPV